jgi:hypothetical protein
VRQKRTGIGEGSAPVKRTVKPLAPAASYSTKMEQTNKKTRGQKGGRQRGNRARFPYEPRFVGGKLILPAELQRIHSIVLDAVEVETISDEMRAVVESLWPELSYKLPPKP